jgi:hypothetical protein
MLIRSLNLKGARFFSYLSQTTLTYSKFIQEIAKIKIPDNYQHDLCSNLMQSTHPSPHESIAFSNSIKVDDFCLNSQNYTDYLKQDQFGSVEAFEYKNTQFCFIGACYTHIPPENIWTMMSIFDPDHILVQLYPDDYVHPFKLNRRNPKSNEFSNRLYVDQLTRTTAQYPNQTILNKVVQSVSHISNISLDITTNSEHVVNAQCIASSFDKITDEIATTAFIYAHSRSVPLIYSDVPDFILRNN